MLNAQPDDPALAAAQDKAADDIVLTGSRGAIALAGIATAIVAVIWFAFYLLVFVPRGAGP
ncbi:MAG TPA: hypothetical protein VJ779_15380 [Acetobacteraceae bacterium]|jgi:hypothetical protein|nr:hypothetical protein [Acetobacteraceae bacterium]